MMREKRDKSVSEKNEKKFSHAWLKWGEFLPLYLWRGDKTRKDSKELPGKRCLRREGKKSFEKLTLYHHIKNTLNLWKILV